MTTDPVATAACAVCGGAPESTRHLGIDPKGHRYEPATAALITVNHDDLEATVNLVDRLRQHLTAREWFRLPENEREALDRIRGVTDADYQ